MAKGKSTWKYNKLLTARRNYYALGTNGFNNPTGLGIDFTSNANGANIDPNNLPGSLGGGSVPATKSPNFLQQGFSTMGGMFKDPIGTLTGASPAGLGAASMISAGIGAIGGVAGNLLSNGMSSGAGNIVSGVGDALGSVPILGGLAKGALNIVGGGINALFGMKTNQAELNRVNSATASMADAANAASSAQSFDDSSLAGPNAVNFNVNAYKGGLFKKRKAKRKNAALAAELRAANDFANRTAANSIENLQDEQLDNALGNFAAFGGELNTQGGDFTNGLLYIDNGGSHESNPFEGVPMGVDPEGVPNLVEEGETIFNDYVFSKRLKVPKAVRDKYKMRGTKDLTFAEMSKAMAKESEERPNDPISMRGLQAIMADLSNAQEEVKESDNNQFKEGGNLFKKGGGKRKGYTYNNTSNDATIANSALFSPYFSNGTFDFNAMYADGSEYRKRLNPIASALYKRKLDPNYKYNDEELGYLNSYMGSVNTWNPNNKYSSVDQLTYDRIIGDALTTTDGSTFTYNPNATSRGYALDQKRGGHHYGVGAVNVAPKTAAANRYFEYGTGNQFNDYFEGRNDKGQTWFDLNPGYSLVDKNGTVRDPIDEDGISTTYTDYFLKKAEPETPEDTEDEEEWKPGKYASWLRYAPAVGFGISAITDAAGLTNKPDYSNADAVLEASRGAGTYQPVEFKPIGNYLTYRPFDRDYYLNKMNAEAGASRRSLINTAGGNRGAAMAGILAADNNYLNQVGSLARQAEEYNLAQRNQVEDFNRSTNITNSQGFLQADMANQKALMEQRELSLKGVMAAADMRERARLASDQNKSANLSGLFQSLGDIGYDEANRSMVDYALGHELSGTGAESGYYFTKGKKKPAKQANTGARGKLKRKKGLTV